jgi:hypothetical protein
MKSAMAEEKLLALAFRSPALLDHAGNLTQDSFSSPLLGKVYAQLKDRHQQALEVSPAVLEGLSQEEMSHVAGLLQRQQGPVSEQAFDDCVRIIRAEHQASNVTTEDDLLAYQNQLRERKGIKG